MKPIKYILLLLLLLAYVFGFSQSSVSYNLVCWDSSSIIRTLKLRTYEAQGFGSVSEYRDLITNSVVVPTVGIVADCAIIASNMCNTADTSIYTYNGTIPDGVDRHVFFEDDSRLDFVRPDGGRMLYLNQADSQVIITTFNNQGTFRAKLDQLEMNYLNTGIFLISPALAMFYEGRGIGNRFGIEYQNPTSSEWRPNTLITKQYFEDNDINLYSADGVIAENRIAQLTGDSLIFLDDTGAARLIGYNTIGPKYIWGFQSQDSLAQVYSGSNEVGFFSPNIGEFSFDINTGKAVLNDTRATKLGFEYLADYSAGILTNNRSIPDVGMVNGLIADSLAGLTFDNIYTADGNIPSLRKVDITPTNGQGIKFFDTADEANYYLWFDPQFGNRLNQPTFFNSTSTFTGASTFNGLSTFTGGITTILGSGDSFAVSDGRATTLGIQYSGDYSAGFAARSLIDKGYADATYAPLALPTIFTSGGSITGNNNIDLDMANFLSWRDNDDVIRVRWGNLEEVFETWTKSEVSSVGANATELYFKGTTVGGFTLDETAATFEFEDARAGGSQTGIEYTADYSADILPNDRSIPDVGAVKSLISDSLATIPAGGSTASMRNQKFIYFDDLTNIIATSGTNIGDYAHGAVTVASSGIIAAQDTSQAEPNILSISTGTINAAGMGRLNFPHLYQKANNDFMVEFMAKTDTIQAVAGAYSLAIGISQNGANPLTEGMVFYSKDAYGNNNWHTWTTKAGAGSELNTGVEAVANTWYKLKIEYDHAPTPTVNYYINDVLVQSTTTNISSQAMYPFFQIDKSSVAARRYLFCDWLYSERARSY